MLQFNQVEEKDINTLVSIKKRAFEDEFKKYGFIPEDMIAIEWHRKMMDTSIYYAIRNNGEIIGGVNIFRGNKGEAYLCSLFIDKRLQNKGLGTESIKELERLHSDCYKWGLETPAMSTQNHRFYEKSGYKHVRDITPDGAPEGFSLRVYEKLKTT